MSALLNQVDSDKLLEFSVVYTDRSLNHMSIAFQHVMRDISTGLRAVYNADSVAVVPGGGTYAMESVVRALAVNDKALILRNGWFSFRWTQILTAAGVEVKHNVLLAQPETTQSHSPFSPPALKDLLGEIKKHRPTIVFAPHVETSSGIILPDAYIVQMAQAVHAVGGLLVLDCIASGCIWIDMKKLGVDVLISAPQKGWSSFPCVGLVMMNAVARARVKKNSINNRGSFALNLDTWCKIMETYENGGHAYHATMPTDALRAFRDVMFEAQEYGFERLKAAQQVLGSKIRTLLAEKGFVSVAADGFAAAGVVVCYTDDAGLHDGSKFAKHGMQIAAGVPLRCGESADFLTFRIGLFGLDKLYDINATFSRFKQILDKVI